MAANKRRGAPWLHRIAEILSQSSHFATIQPYSLAAVSNSYQGVNKIVAFLQHVHINRCGLCLIPDLGVAYAVSIRIVRAEGRSESGTLSINGDGAKLVNSMVQPAIKLEIPNEH